MIVSGQLRPGDRLPTRRALADEFGTTLVTVQKALSRLEAAGFVSSRGRDGSYVADRPPHLYRYGIVFAELPTAGSEGWYWSKFWSLIANASVAAATAADREIVCYSGVGDWVHGEDVQHLIADAANDRLAGLIIAGPVNPEWPLFDLIQRHEIPTVQIAASNPSAGMSVRLGECYEMVSGRLAEMGCQTASLLMPEFLNDAGVDAYHKSLEAVGITARPSQVIGLDPREPRWIRNWTRLLMEAARPPQALWITDDNLVEQAALGLADAGVVVGRDLTVVAHANLPIDQPSPRGFLRYGADARELLDKCFAKLIDPANAGNVCGVVESRWETE